MIQFKLIEVCITCGLNLIDVSGGPALNFKTCVALKKKKKINRMKYNVPFVPTEATRFRVSPLL